MKRARAVFGLLLLAATACVVEARPRPPPPRLIGPQEAVAAATYFARARGLTIEHTRRLHLDRRGRWHVELAGAAGRDHASVVVDGYSSRVIAARLRGPRGEWTPEPLPPGTGPAPPSPPVGAEPPPASLPPEGASPEPPVELPPPPPGAQAP